MITVFTAKSIITMDPALPRATAVAVADGQILEAGTLATLAPWLDGKEHRVDTQFEEHYLTPGLIDPHLHPAMAAVLLPMHFITALEWQFPWGDVPATKTAAAFDARLADIAAAADPSEMLFAWGYHQRWHGAMSRARINAVSTEQPIVVWHRSFHELLMNDAALALLGITEETVGARPQIDLPNGRFYENGLGDAIMKLNPYLLAPERFRAGLERLKQVVHFGGQTTIGDMAVGIFDWDLEVTSLSAVFDNDDTPFRIELVPHGAIAGRGRTDEETAEFLAALPDTNTHRLRFARRIKLFSDGAFFSELAQLLPPGYLDGHDGEWLTAPEQLRAAIRNYWLLDYQIHVHVCGDLALDLVLDCVSEMQNDHPRVQHGFTIEHFGFSRPHQITRAAALGVNVSANVYYLHELSEVYAQESVGQHRASHMARVGSCFNHGITTAFHSDFTMAPAQPLNSMWVAVNRINEAGNVMGPTERISAADALAAVTINAATVLGRGDDLGSIEPGKRADFTVLDADPLTVAPERIRAIKPLATVFEGTVHHIDSES